MINYNLNPNPKRCSYLISNHTLNKINFSKDTCEKFFSNKNSEKDVHEEEN